MSARRLDDILASFIAEATERFPALEGQLLICDMNTRKVYGAEALDPAKTDLAPEAAQDHVMSHPSGNAEKKNKGKSAAVNDAAHNVRIIFFNDEIDPAAPLPAQLEQHILFTLDHELGHCAIRDGFPKASGLAAYATEDAAEHIADAYALIRHYQRYGTDDYGLDIAAQRAQALAANGDTPHFTTFVLDAIARQKEQVDFSRLNADEIALLAHEYATLHMPRITDAFALHDAFEPVAAAFEKNPAAGVKALIDKTLTAEDAQTFRLGDAWLKACLGRQRLPDGTPLRLPRQYADDAAKRLKKKREMKLNQRERH